MNFSIRNTALATTTGVQKLRRVPGGSTIFELSLLLSPDIADDVGEHKHRSPPPTLHPPRTFASAAHSRCPPQGRLRPAGQQARSAGGSSRGGRPPRAGVAALRHRREVSPCRQTVPLPTTRGARVGTLTSPGLPNPGAQHAPGWALRCRQRQRPAPAPAAAPRIAAPAALRSNATSLRFQLWLEGDASHGAK